MKIPNNPAVKAGNTIYFGGIAPLGADGMVAAKGDVGGQVKTILDRMENYLKKAGMTLENMVFVTIYLSDLKLYEEMNRAYAQYMPGPYPARKVIQAPMTLEGMVVEMTGIASQDKKEIL